MANKKTKTTASVATPTSTQSQLTESTGSKKKQEKKTKKQEQIIEEEEQVVEEQEVSEETDSPKKKRTVQTKESILEAMDEVISLVEGEIENLRTSQQKTKGIKFLRTINKKFKQIRNHSNRVMKSKSGIKKQTNNSNSGFLKPVPISAEMAKFTGWDPSENKSRVDVTKFICAYVKEHDLQNPNDRRQIIADAKLSKLLKYDSKKETEPLTYYKVQSYLKNHFPKTQKAISASN